VQSILKPGIHNMYVYESDVPAYLYQHLNALVESGEPSGYQESGPFGETGDAEFPPL